MEIATALQDRFGEPINWKKSSDAQNKMLRDAVAQETARAVDLHPEAKGWYDENIKLTVDVLKELDPDISKPENDFIFKILLAATSDGNKVRPQFLQSWDEYTNWKNTGKISGQFVSGDRVSNIRKNLFKVEAMIQAVGWEKVRDFLTKKGTVSEIRESLVKDFGLTKQEAAKIGTSELADEVVPYAIVLGPKLGSFFNNLYGDFSSVTMDRWFMRTMGRLTGTQVDTSAFKKVRSLRATLRESISKLTSSEKEFLKISSDKIKGDNIDAAAKSISTRFAKKETRDRAAQLESEGRPFMEEVRKRSNALKKIQSPLVEAPLNGRHRRWIRQRIAEVQGELKSRGIELENADLQAVLWYLEKELYDKLNYRAKPGDSDYASAAAHLYERVVGQPSSVYAGATGRIRAVGGGGSDVAMGTTNPAEARAAVGEQRYMPAGDMATGRSVKDHREAMDLFEKGYRLYGALYDGMEDPIRLKKASEIEKYDPENLWAVPSKKIAAAIGIRNMPASDTDYLSAVKKGDTAAAQRMVDEAAKAAGAINDAKPLYHGGNKTKTSFASGATRSGMGLAYLTDNKNAAWKYALGGGVNSEMSLADYRRQQLKKLPSREPTVQRLYVIGDVADFSSYSERPSAPQLIEMFGEKRMSRILEEYRSQYRDELDRGESIESVLDTALQEGGFVQEDTDATAKVPELQFLAGSQLLNEYLSAIKKNVVAYNDAEAGGKTYVVFDPTQIKSADPITKDNAGNVIPLSQRFKATSEDIRYMPGEATIYRAGDKTETGVKAFSSWSENKSTAEAYLDNPGFGGAVLRSEKVPLNSVLDADTTNRKGMERLARQLGFDAGAGDEWFDNGWKYPWEESKSVKEALKKSGFDAIRYPDDFPEGATSIVPLKDFAGSENNRFMPSPDSAMPGAYSFPGGYRALPGKAKGSLRLYGPAGSLIGIASSLDEAQRILRRKNK
jgi:hypothetical protein